MVVRAEEVAVVVAADALDVLHDVEDGPSVVVLYCHLWLGMA